MQRRQLLAIGSTTVAGLVAGCLDAAIDHLDPHGDPAPDWTPAADNPADAVEALAYVSLTLEGCAVDRGDLSPTTPNPLDGAPPDPPIAVAMAGEVTGTDSAAIEGCTVLSSSDPSYLNDPGGFLEESHPDATVVIAIAASDIGSIAIETIGILPNGAMFVGIETESGPHSRLGLARVGYWNDPTGLTITLSATTATGKRRQGTYELATS